MSLSDAYEISSSDNYNADEVRFEIIFDSQIIRYQRYPDTILMGLQKLGSLIPLFKVSLILGWLHKLYFERQLKERYN